MKNLTAILSILSFIGVLAIGGMMMSQKNDDAPKPKKEEEAKSGSLLAYVNIDSLEANYVLLKSNREKLQKRQEQMENELQRSYGQMQSDANEVQKKAQANALTQTEYEAAQKRLMQMQQTLESRKQSLTEQLMKEQEEFNLDLKRRLDAFLAEYNKSHNYDYIMSYSSAGSAILFAKDAHDITTDVVEGLNALAKTEDSKK